VSSAASGIPLVRLCGNPGELTLAGGALETGRDDGFLRRASSKEIPSIRYTLLLLNQLLYLAIDVFNCIRHAGHTSVAVAYEVVGVGNTGVRVGQVSWY